MTRSLGEPPPPRIRMLGGSPDYLAATGLQDQHGTPFDEALTLARRQRRTLPPDTAGEDSAT